MGGIACHSTIRSLSTGHRLSVVPSHPRLLAPYACSVPDVAYQWYEHTPRLIAPYAQYRPLRIRSLGR
eukprot:3670482-Rhodomonas_salina.2